MNALDEAFQIKQYMVEQRNYFHSHPELGLQEFNTCNRIEEELTKSRLSSRRVAGTNVIAEIDSGQPGKTRAHSGTGKKGERPHGSRKHALAAQRRLPIVA